MFSTSSLKRKSQPRGWAPPSRSYGTSPFQFGVQHQLFYSQQAPPCCASKVIQNLSQVLIAKLRTIHFSWSHCAVHILLNMFVDRFAHEGKATLELPVEWRTPAPNCMFIGWPVSPMVRWQVIDRIHKLVDGLRWSKTFCDIRSSAREVPRSYCPS